VATIEKMYNIEGKVTSINDFEIQKLTEASMVFVQDKIYKDYKAKNVFKTGA
jgi:hypothetical protein